MTDPIWVAFLRGMNLGGRRLTNDELDAAVTACGCDDVETYQASGNVILRDARTRDVLAAALEDGLEAELGYPVPTFLRSAEEVRALAGSAPFSDDELAASAGKRQVVLLHETPSDDALAEIASIVPPDDRLIPAGRELHWLPAAGLSDSAMDLRRLDELTGGTTTRTHGTIERLTARFL